MFKYIFIVFSTLLHLPLFGQNPAPTNDCNTAGIFCTRESLHDHTWILPPMDLNDPPIVPNRLCDTSNGSINNPLYFGFVASGVTANIRIIPVTFTPGPTGPETGYQWAVFEGCNMQDPVWILCEGMPEIGTTNINLTGLKPGHTYYLMIDGNSGCGVEFIIQVLSGIPSASAPFTVDEPENFTNSLGESWEIGDTIDFCRNGFFTSYINGVSNAPEFEWATVNAEGEKTILQIGADSLEFTFTNDSLYQICVTALTDCDISETACFYVNVQSEPDIDLGAFEYCRPELTSGVTPAGWEGPVITQQGIYQHTITDTIIGCTQNQYVNIITKPVIFGVLDIVSCGMDTIFFQSDTITGNYFENQYTFPGQASNGCDSILNFKMTRFNYEGTLSGYSCIGIGKYGLEIASLNILPANYDSITIQWFNGPFAVINTNANKMILELTQKGEYRAIVSVWKGGYACDFNLGPVEVTALISPLFTVEQDSICVTDTIYVQVNEWFDLANYTFLNADQQITNIPGRYGLKWNNPGDYNIVLRVDFDLCNVLSGVTTVHVEEELVVPVIQCTTLSNSAFNVNWDPVDCAAGYQIFSDGIFITETTATTYPFTGMNIGTQYEIEILAVSECLCPSVSSTIFCSTNPCADNITVNIDPFDQGICLDEFTTDLTLTGEAIGSNGGTFVWSGAIISPDGKISSQGLSPGIYPLTLTYTIDNCPYSAVEILEVFPSVDAEIAAMDISCFYNQDGEISVTPTGGTPPFAITINGTGMSDFIIRGLAEGTYNILLTDDNQCKYSETVEILRPYKPHISINGTTVIQRGQNYEYLLKLDELVYDSVRWFIPEMDTVLCSGICDEIVYQPLEDHHLCIMVFYDDQCSIDTCIQITVKTDFKFFVPNVFSPNNNDGVNDYFMVKTNSNRDMRIVQFNVYDRWGERVFYERNMIFNRSTGERSGWDGSFNGKKLNPGVFIYYLEIEDSDGIIHKLTGDITLLR